jgi:hypothetical protein
MTLRRDTTVLVRMSATERRFLDAAVEKRTSELAKTAPGTRVHLGPLMRSLALQWAEQVTGVSSEATP